jgi:hypothetical protein
MQAFSRIGCGLLQRTPVGRTFAGREEKIARHMSWRFSEFQFVPVTAVTGILRSLCQQPVTGKSKIFET